MLEQLVLAPGAGKVPRSLVSDCARFCSLRLITNRLDVSKVRCKGSGLRPSLKALLVYKAQGLLRWQGQGCAEVSYPVLWRQTRSCGSGYLAR